MSDFTYVISWMAFVPFCVALGLATLTALARIAGRDLHTRWWIGAGVAAALFSASLAIGMWLDFDPAASVEVQYLEFLPWIPELGIHYHVGVDGFGLLLIGMTTFLTLIVTVASFDEVRDRLRTWVFCVLTLETALIGAFASLNLMQFVVFWQWALLAMAFAIGIWGGVARVRAALRFLGLGTAGVLVLAVAGLILHHLHAEQFGVASFDLIASSPGGTGLLDTLVPARGAAASQRFLFLAFAFALAIPSALAPFHLWLADAHAEAPTGASVLIAGIGVKLGVFGFLRFALPLFPVAAVEFAGPIMALAAGGVVYAALLALVQEDLKRTLAYASMSQLGLVLLGIFAFNVAGLEGGVLQAVHHGIALAALFLLAGMIQGRRQTLRFDEFGGITKPMPIFATFFAVSVFATVGVPLLSGFAGQFLVLLGAFDVAPAVAVLAIGGAGLAAVALVWSFRRVALGPVEKAENRGLIDLGWQERMVLIALVVPMFWIGINPEALTSRLHQPVLTLRRVMLDRATATLDAGADPLARAAIERLTTRSGAASTAPSGEAPPAEGGAR